MVGKHRRMSLLSRAWTIDPVELHREVDDLVRTDRLRQRAIEIRETADPVARTYLEVIRTASSDEWTDTDNGTHVLEWYLTVIASHVTPTRAYRAPDQLRRRLPELGWSASEARRVAHGRELQLLVETFADDRSAAVLTPQFTVAAKGWLSATDVATTLERMRAIDPAVFRRHQDLVELVEHAYEVLDAAAARPDCVLLMLAD
jgi:hypothetical protein